MSTEIDSKKSEKVMTAEPFRWLAQAPMGKTYTDPIGCQPCDFYRLTPEGALFHALFYRLTREWDILYIKEDIFLLIAKAFSNHRQCLWFSLYKKTGMLD